jgi:glutathione synthase
VLSAGEETHLDEVDAVFMRKDPPVDLQYFDALHILGRIDRGTVVVNCAEGIRRVNEKLYPLGFPHLAPRSIVTSSSKHILCFLEDVGGQMVVKPLNESSGRGVVYLRLGDLNVRSILDMVTVHGRQFVIAQEFLPEVMDKGDKRILMLAGLPLGVMLRIPAPGEYRANIHQGARFAPAVLDGTDRAICAALGPRLVADGIYLAGIDVVGGKVLEVNVTSPAGIPEMNKLTGSHLEEAVIDWLEQEVGTRGGE